MTDKEIIKCLDHFIAPLGFRRKGACDKEWGMKLPASVFGVLIGALLSPSLVQAQTYSKTETIEYHDDLSLWVLGQVKRTTTNGVETSRTEYGWKASPTKTYAFGKLQQTIGYNTSDGTVSHVVDGKNNLTILRSWMRGIPRQIEYADGYSQYATVNDSGWITSVTDENGYATGYGYDAMGRLERIDYPSGDSTNWDTTWRYFEQVNEEEYGLAPGHWRLIENTDDYMKVVYFDALWRPVVEQEEDLTDDVATLRWRNMRYDHEGRLTFASYPRNPYVDGWTDYTGAPWGPQSTPLAGAHTTYDTLGRVTHVKQDSELGQLTTTTRYLSGFLTEVTNPRNQSTITGYVAYDRPTYDWPVSISHPEGAYTDIVRDVFGKPTSLTRRNNTGSLQVQRHYVYDSHQRLCKSIEPETGTTLYQYDNAGNLIRTDYGMPAFSPSACDESTTAMMTMAGPPTGGNNPPQMANFALRTYDTRNRLKTLTFQDNNGDQSWVYTPDGLPQRITTLNSEGLDVAVNEYFYSKRRLLTAETLGQPDWYTWRVDYDYNGKGHLSGQEYPNGLYIDYDVNALGQPRQAGSYATGVQYYPNGAIKQFTYGNGIVHTMTQNTRQLPDRVQSGNAAGYEYQYDGNANPTQIHDVVRGTHYSRTLQYDGLDRLTAAGSAMFGGDHWHRFTYNVLDNLTSWKLTGVKDYASYYYDPETNRLTNILNTTGASVVGLGYDRQGNLANRNGQAYLFDYGNRLREVPDKEGYHYDGHGRRIMSWRPDGALNFSFYGQSGQLWYHEYDAKSLAVENVYLAGSLIASREFDWSAGTFTTKYHHTDALGSPVAVTNAAGQVTERTDWEPYGAAIGKLNYEGIGFTGHVQDAATGLTYMQQRYYDPQLGLFLSVDPVPALSDIAGSFNRYRYANSNPYRYFDPDGRAVERIMDGEIRGADTIVDLKPVVVRPERSSTEALVLHRTVSSSSASAIGAAVSSGGSTSFHIVIDRNGVTTQIANLKNIANHVGKPTGTVSNRNSIGIEVVGNYDGATKTWDPLTPEQIEATAQAIYAISSAYGIHSSKMFPHEDVSRKTSGEGGVVIQAVQSRLNGIYRNAAIPPPFDSSLRGSTP